MPTVDWDGIQDGDQYSLLPDGAYVTRVDNVQEKYTQNGDPMWSVSLKVEAGPHAGRLIFDNIVFSAKALPRAKFILSRLGVETKGKMTVVPEMILDRRALVTIYTEESVYNGKPQKRNTVEFNGYEAIRDDPAPKVAQPGTRIEELKEDEVPF